MAPNAKTPKIDAGRLVELLAEKHAKDVFVPECKNGGTWYPGPAGVLRLDAWVLRKTWSPWTIIGYEVKVSRSDFEQDQKWHGYLSYCHQFYFVCPSGLIRAVDLPKGVGLIWCSANGSRLYTKTKATRHEPDQESLAQLMSYVLMSRTRIVADMHEAAQQEELPIGKLATYRNWVEDAEECQDLAHFIRGHIRKRVDAADKEHLHARRLTENAERFAKRLERLGITWDVGKRDWAHRHEVEREIDRLDRGLGEHTRARLRSAANAMVRALDELERSERQEQP
jgi:hypothetical protein